jgi:NAD(P)-dependent dehydrogenase (short-subunit alcohol dehydrogenase family)
MDIKLSDRLAGRVAIVTGAGGGIGREHARLLAAHGAKVVVNDIGVRKGADARSVVQEIKESGGEAVASTDSATWSGAEAIVNQALETYGRLDILVNNAMVGHYCDLWDEAESQYDATMDVNLKGYFALVRHAAVPMAEQGSGAIVNTSSASGYGHPAHSSYSTAKEGVVGLTRAVAAELGRFGVRCNAIRPQASGQSGADYAVTTAKWTKLISLGMHPRTVSVLPRMLADPELSPPRKISPLVVWLCTEAAANINGRTFEVWGNTICLLSEPEPLRTLTSDHDWDLDQLDALAPTVLAADLENRFTLRDHPDLRVFTRD